MQHSEFDAALRRQVERGEIRTATRRTYLSELKSFRRWWDAQDDPAVSQTIGGQREPTTEAVTRYLEHCRDQLGLAPSTLQGRYSALKRYFGWHDGLTPSGLSGSVTALLGGELSDDSESAVPAPNTSTVKALLGGVSDPEAQALIRVFRRTGLQSSEVLALNVEDVVLSREAALERGNDIPGLVDFAASTFDPAGVLCVPARDGTSSMNRYRLSTSDTTALRDYLDRRNAGEYGDPDHPALFQTKRGRMSDDTATRRIREAVAVAGVEETVTPTRLRNWVGRTLGAADVDYRVIAGVLGLANPSTARRFMPTTDDGDPTDRDVVDALLSVDPDSY